MGKSTTKDRSKQIRIFDEDGFRKRADAIIFKDKLYAEVMMSLSLRAHVLPSMVSFLYIAMEPLNKHFDSPL